MQSRSNCEQTIVCLLNFEFVLRSVCMYQFSLWQIELSTKIAPHKNNYTSLKKIYPSSFFLWTFPQTANLMNDKQFLKMEILKKVLV